MAATEEAKAYEEELREWALHQAPANLRGVITSMEYGENGVVLEVSIPFPSAPSVPEGIDKQPEDVKEGYHRAVVNQLRTEYSISALRLGPINLNHLGGVNPFLRDIAEEETNWQAHLEKVKAKAPTPG
jgi:hypothetical protein